MWFCHICIAFHSLVLGTHSCGDGEAPGAGITERPLPSLLLGDLQSQNLHLFINGVRVVPNPPPTPGILWRSPESGEPLPSVKGVVGT